MSSTLEETTGEDTARRSFDTAEAGDSDPDPDLAERLDGLSLYLRDIERYPLLTPAEERRLAERVASGDPAARERLICSNLRLVVSIARRYQGYGLELLDLIQQGTIGLMRAIDKFEATRGLKLSTYATAWIEQAIGRGLADTGTTIRVPVHRGVEVRALRRAEARLVARGDETTDEAIAALLETTPAAIADTRRTAALAQVTSLSTPLGDDSDGDELGSVVEDSETPDPAVQVGQAAEREALTDGLSVLTKDERRVIELRYGLNGSPTLDLLGIARKLKLRREDVRALERRAVGKLGGLDVLSNA